MRTERVVIAVAGSMLVVNWKRDGKISTYPSRHPPRDHSAGLEPARQPAEIREGSPRTPATFG